MSAVPETPIRDAASVLVTRDTTEGLVVFMVRRHARSAWLPQMYVFPGGAVDAADRQADARARIRGDAGAIEPSFVVTAARETFEEVGVLFADRPIEAETLANARRALLAGELTFGELLGRVDAAVDATQLRFFSRWVTPPLEVRRFDARFFVGRLPQDQVAEADAVEVNEGRWFRPLEALAAFERHEIGMIFPTRMHLERIAPYRTVDELLAFAAQKPIRTVEPEYSNGDLALPSGLADAW